MCRLLMHEAQVHAGVPEADWSKFKQAADHNHQAAPWGHARAQSEPGVVYDDKLPACAYISIQLNMINLYRSTRSFSALHLLPTRLLLLSRK